MVECAVATAKANVMLYDSKASTWIPSGPGHGISKVQLYHNTLTNAYRVVGWRLPDREVVINCAIARGLKYHQARPTFHQWRDSRQQVYGLNFTSVEEADAFAAAVKSALESLAALHRQQALQSQQQQQCRPPVTCDQLPSNVTTTANISYQQDMQQNQYQQPNHQIPSQQLLPNQQVTNQAYPVQPTGISLQKRPTLSSDLAESTESYGGPNNKHLPSASLNQQSERDTSCNDYEKMVNGVNDIILNDNQNVYPGVTTSKTNASSQQNTEISRVKSSVEQNTYPTNGYLMNDTVEHGVNCDSPYYSSSDDSVRNLHGLPNGFNGPHVNSTTSMILNTTDFQNKDSNESSLNTRSLSPNPCTSTNSNKSQQSIPAPPPLPPQTPIPPPPPPPIANVLGSKTWRQNSTSITTTTATNKPSGSQSAADNSDTSDYDGVNESSSFDTQLRMARQQRIRAASVAGLGSSDSSSTIPRTHGVDMMTDLQRVLAARRRAKEAEEDSNATTGVLSTSNNTTSTSTTITNSNNDIPIATSPIRSHSVTANVSTSVNSSSSSIVPGYATLRKASTPALDSTTLNNLANTCSNSISTAVNRADLEIFKRELISEFRREVQQLKNDVIEALRASSIRNC
ncbi:unnamed protein product [Schistosoma turkestanicum]|nr:unnamed protein product [Schistosoma turkestanicum]